MQYRDQIPDSVLQAYARDMNYRARQMRAIGELQIVDLRSVILESGGRCQWCGGSVIDADFEIDHIISLSRGGTNTPENLAVACMNCNRRKGDKSPLQFAHEQVVRLGYQTLLVKRVLHKHNSEARFQKSLFDSEEGEPPLDQDVDDSDIPPVYKW